MVSSLMCHWTICFRDLSARFSEPLLQTQQHQNRARTFLKRLKRFADQGAGTVELDAAEVDGLGLHGDAGNVAGDEQIADVNLAASGIDFHADSAGGRNQNLAVALFTQSNARLF